jgi:hypothetical protein
MHMEVIRQGVEFLANKRDDSVPGLVTPIALTTIFDSFTPSSFPLTLILGILLRLINYDSLII